MICRLVVTILPDSLPLAVFYCPRIDVSDRLRLYPFSVQLRIQIHRMIEYLAVPVGILLSIVGVFPVIIIVFPIIAGFYHLSQQGVVIQRILIVSGVFDHISRL